MKDPYANFVVQKILEMGNEKQKETLLNHARLHIHALRKYTYGKHIAARCEQLSGEGERWFLFTLFCVHIHAEPKLCC